MELLKRLTILAMALVVVMQFCGCSQLDMEDQDSESGPARTSDSKKIAERKKREEANKKLQSGYARVNQALSLAQTALQAKLPGNSAFDAQAAPTAAKAAEPAKGAIPGRPAEAPKGAGTTAGAVGAKEEGVAAAAQAGPKVPEIIPQGALANQLVGQAYAVLEEVKKDTKDLCCAGAYANDPKVVSLKNLIDAAEKLIQVAAGLDPVNPDVLALAKQAAAPAGATCTTGAGATSGGAGATSGGVPGRTSVAGPVSKGH